MTAGTLDLFDCDLAGQPLATSFGAWQGSEASLEGHQVVGEDLAEAGGRARCERVLGGRSTPDGLDLRKCGLFRTRQGARQATFVVRGYEATPAIYSATFYNF